MISPFKEHFTYVLFLVNKKNMIAKVLHTSLILTK